MAKLDRESIGVAFDTQGCPNRCRHCWLGRAEGPSLSVEDVRWGVSRFREFIAGAPRPGRRRVDAATVRRLSGYAGSAITAPYVYSAVDRTVRAVERLA